MQALTYTIKALTDIWTGDTDRKADRLITTGLLGSIRWWFEVLVRGLGGSACDPTRDGNRCPDHRKNPGEPGHHCVVCELFGCTGWARKFRFDVSCANNKNKAPQIKTGTTFQLYFTELRPVKPEEWALLDLTLRLIEQYGAIGGKTVLKPSDEPSRAHADHHRDYGLIRIQQRPKDIPSFHQKTIEEYVSQRTWRGPKHDDFRWASLENLWCVNNRYLARQDAHTSTFNKVVGRDERKLCKGCGKVHNPPQRCPKTKKHTRRWSDDIPSDQPDRWLAGKQQESKKVFSFKEPQQVRRTFGFVKPGTVDFNVIKSRLITVWSDLRDDEFVCGQEILKRLFSVEGVPS